MTLLEFFPKLVLFLFLVEDSNLEVVLVLSLQIKLVFLSVESLLHPCLILLGNIILIDHTILLLSHGLILDHGLLKEGSEPHALLNIGLDINLRLLVLAHLDIPLELLNLSVLLVNVSLHVPVLLLQLLNQERLQIVCLL